MRPKGYAALGNRKPVGRPATDMAERMRIAVWYYACRGRGRNNYQLDLEFGNADSEMRPRGADRDRLFESIERRYSLPGTEDQKWKLVSRVSANPLFAGTDRCFGSLYWRFISKAERMLRVESLLEEFCAKYRTSTVNEWSDAILKVYGGKLSAEDVYENRYQENIRPIFLDEGSFNLDLLGFAGAMYRSVLPDKVLSKIYCHAYLRLIIEFRDQPWMETIAMKFSRLAGERLDYWSALEADEISSVSL